MVSERETTARQRWKVFCGSCLRCDPPVMADAVFARVDYICELAALSSSSVLLYCIVLW